YFHIVQLQRPRLSFQPGVNLFLTNRVSAEVIFDVAAFNAHFNRINDSSGNEDKTASYDYRFNFNLQNITVGFQFFFGRSKVLEKDVQ
ncbi:MAG: hypothetical protein ACJ75J_08720, partial [Cytophagaceae bacterium]